MGITDKLAEFLIGINSRLNEDIKEFEKRFSFSESEKRFIEHIYKYPNVQIPHEIQEELRISSIESFVNKLNQKLDANDGISKGDKIIEILFYQNENNPILELGTLGNEYIVTRTNLEARQWKYKKRTLPITIVTIIVLVVIGAAISLYPVFQPQSADNEAMTPTATLTPILISTTTPTQTSTPTLTVTPTLTNTSSPTPTLTNTVTSTSTLKPTPTLTPTQFCIDYGWLVWPDNESINALAENNVNMCRENVHNRTMFGNVDDGNSYAPRYRIVVNDAIPLTTGMIYKPINDLIDNEQVFRIIFSDISSRDECKQAGRCDANLVIGISSAPEINDPIDHSNGLFFNFRVITHYENDSDKKLLICLQKHLLSGCNFVPEFNTSTHNSPFFTEWQSKEHEIRFLIKGYEAFVTVNDVPIFDGKPFQLSSHEAGENYLFIGYYFIRGGSMDASVYPVKNFDESTIDN